MVSNPSSLHLYSNLPYNYSSSSDEEEEDRLRREEQEEAEQERVLSRQYGEAIERGGQRRGSNDNNNNSNNNATRKRSHQQTDAEIIDTLNSKSANSNVTSSSNTNDANGTTSQSNDEVKTKRIKRIVLNESKLTGSKGLINVRREFPTLIQYKEPKKLSMKDIHKKRNKKSHSSQQEQRKAIKRKQFELDIRASATYISKLMKAYHNFAVDIAPNTHPTDTFRKIESLGSKKQVRDYLDMMRQDICKDHLQKIYGNDRAEKLVNELEDGMKAHQQEMMVEGLEGKSGSRYGNNGDGGVKNAAVLNNLRATRNVGVLVENNDNEISEANDLNDKLDENDDNLLSNKASEKAETSSTTNDNIGSAKKDRDNAVDNDDEEENEATFDDVVGGKSQEETTENPQRSDFEEQDEQEAPYFDEEKVNEDTLEHLKSSNHDKEKSNGKDNQKQQIETINNMKDNSDVDNERSNSNSNIVTDDPPAKVVGEEATMDEGEIIDESERHDDVEANGDKEVDVQNNINDVEPSISVEGEKSMIVELTPQTQDINTQEELVLDMSQSFGKNNNPNCTEMTQNTLSQFEDTNNDDFVLDASKNPSNSGIDVDEEAETVVPTMTPSDWISQDY